MGGKTAKTLSIQRTHDFRMNRHHSCHVYVRMLEKTRDGAIRLNTMFLGEQKQHNLSLIHISEPTRPY